LLSGGTPSKSNTSYWQGTIPWYSSKELKSFELSDSELHVSSEGATSGSNLVPPGTVLFVVRGMSLANEFRVSRTLVEATFNQDVKALVPAPDIDSRYLARCLRWLEPQVLSSTEESSHGTKRLPGQVFENLPVPVPPLAEQRRIADILDKADAIRRKRNEAIALTEELLRSTFLDMFGDPVTNPKGWPMTTLGDEAVEMKYGTSEKCGPPSPSSLPVLRIPNIVGGVIDWSDLKFAALDDRERTSLTLRSNDILFVRSNGNPDYIGRCAVFDSDRTALFASYLIRVRLRDGGLHPSYVRAALSSASYRSRLTAEARTTAGNYNISTEGLRRLRLAVPPLPLQHRFVEVERVASRTQQRLMEQLADSEALFRSLVQRMFHDLNRQHVDQPRD
jgi:type I restriction enzyme S subunit